MIQSSGNEQSSKRTCHATSQDGLHEGSKEASFLFDMLFGHLVIYHSIHAFLVAVSYETQVEAQPCRWKRLSNSILSKPASSQRRGRHVGLILILLTLHQCITTDFEGIIVALLQHQEDEK